MEWRADSFLATHFLCLLHVPDQNDAAGSNVDILQISIFY